MSRFYILEGKEPKPVDDVITWGTWFEVNTESRIVKRTELEDGEVIISTVFLGSDHNYYRGGPPLLFETLIFGGVRDGEMERYPTWEDAEEGHDHMVRLVKEGWRKGDE